MPRASPTTRWPSWLPMCWRWAQSLRPKSCSRDLNANRSNGPPIAGRWSPMTQRAQPAQRDRLRQLSCRARNRQHSGMTRADEVVSGHPFVVAHRGASGDLPEHTLAAYDLALREGADGVECDVRLTRDGHLVCVHDRRLDRTSTGAGLVSTMTLAQLRELEYGAWHGSWRPDGTHGDTSLLTLDALVSLVLDWHRPVKIFVETKHPVRYGSLVGSKLLALLHRFGIAAPPSPGPA